MFNNFAEDICDERYGCDIYELDRHDPRLVSLVEEFDQELCDECCQLAVVEIDSNKYRIVDYDGYESVETPDDIIWIEG